MYKCVYFLRARYEIETEIRRFVERINQNWKNYWSFLLLLVEKKI